MTVLLYKIHHYATTRKISVSFSYRQDVGVATAKSLALSTHFLGRNALALLEAYLRRNRTRTHNKIRERGSIMGPGALRAPTSSWAGGVPFTRLTRLCRIKRRTLASHGARSRNSSGMRCKGFASSQRTQYPFN